MPKSKDNKETQEETQLEDPTQETDRGCLLDLPVPILGGLLTATLEVGFDYYACVVEVTSPIEFANSPTSCLPSNQFATVPDCLMTVHQSGVVRMIV